MDMKDQVLELAEAQDPPYPFVSTHGTFGGTTLAQTRRVLRNGGHLYPSLGNGRELLRDMAEVRAEWQRDGVPYLFGFGFGTDTNGLSGQATARSASEIAEDGAIAYPYQLFGAGWVGGFVPGLDNDGNPATPYAGVQFAQPTEYQLDGKTVGHQWHIDVDGSAHYGMLSEMIEEVRLKIAHDAAAALTEGNTQPMRDLFNSAEVYIQTWERTLASQAGILANDNGGKAKVPAGILREAPVSTSAADAPLLGPLGPGI
jgi:hypothetical protein